MTDYTVHDLPNEPRTTDRNGHRWDYVSVHFEDGQTAHRYYHVNCDAICDKDGYCLLCGSANPSMVKQMIDRARAQNIDAEAAVWKQGRKS